MLDKDCRLEAKTLSSRNVLKAKRLILRLAEDLVFASYLPYSDAGNA